MSRLGVVGLCLLVGGVFGAGVVYCLDKELSLPDSKEVHEAAQAVRNLSK